MKKKKIMKVMAILLVFGMMFHLNVGASAAGGGEKGGSVLAQGNNDAGSVLAQGNDGVGNVLAQGNSDGGNAVVPEGAAVVAQKDETVYARLSDSGEVENIYVVNHFALSEGGTFADYGDYGAVTNLTDLQPLVLQNGTVTGATAAEDFFYQGDMTGRELPWTYQIEYVLDGAEVLPSELAGRSGELAIHLTSLVNEGVKDTFYQHYMQQITVTLGIDQCRNITAAGATAANAGKNRILTFTVMPGSDADITVTAEVQDFTMTGIDIAAVPFSMNIELPDTGGQLAGLSQLSEGLAELDDGTGELNNGAVAMKDGAAQLASGSADFNNGLSRLNNEAAQLMEASAQIQGALAQITAGLQASGMVPAGGPGSAGGAVPGGDAMAANSSMSGGAMMANGVASGNTLTGGGAAAQTQQLLAGIAQLSAQYEAFHNGLLAYTQGLDGLADGYSTLNSGIGDVSDGMAAMQEGISELHDGTSKIAAETADIPEQFQKAIDDLLAEYTGSEFTAVSFAAEENREVGLVQFVFKTAGIEKPEVADAKPVEAEADSFWERLKGLFAG